MILTKNEINELLDLVSSEIQYLQMSILSSDEAKQRTRTLIGISEKLVQMIGSEK
jgi:hypothetical protein